MTIPVDIGESGSTDSCVLPEQLVVFYVGDQRYSLPIEQVAEIQQVVEFSPAPSDARGLLGMLDLRGQVIPAIDGRELLSEKVTPLNIQMPMIVCRTKGGSIALVVDAVHDVLRVPEGCMQDAPQLHAHSASMIGVARFGVELIYVLDADRILAEARR
ncbi:MAG TPA: chemotaxis protein CheW [Coriobacteriia bacterium]|nr:chemotaxis protein CheW [Coriobacteriia bacterium]